jgi:hypothetical protein
VWLHCSQKSLRILKTGNCVIHYRKQCVNCKFVKQGDVLIFRPSHLRAIAPTDNRLFVTNLCVMLAVRNLSPSSTKSLFFVLYGYKTLSFTPVKNMGWGCLTTGHWGINHVFGRKREWTEDCRKLKNSKLRNPYFQSTVNAIKSEIMTWAGHSLLVGEMKSTHEVWLKVLLGGHHLGNQIVLRNSMSKWILTVQSGRVWPRFLLLRMGGHWRILVNTGIDLEFHNMPVIFWLSDC